MEKILRKIIAQYRSNPFLYFLARQSYKYLKKYENWDYRFERNGELWILKKCSDLNFQTIFDVGCNEGIWTANEIKEMPNAKVHSFEINDSVYEKASKRFADYNNVVVNNFGLSAFEETKKAYIVNNNSARTTLVPFGENEDQAVRYGGSIEAKLKNGDLYVEDNNIAGIDFLKIDTEGNEPFVLEGFKKILEEERIKVIQFEYGFHNIKTKFLLHDFYELLQGYGFVLGKLYPKGVAFKDYELRDENFYGPNYIAVHKKYPEIIEALTEPPIRIFKK